jgi:hypothetical protein
VDEDIPADMEDCANPAAGSAQIATAPRKARTVFRFILKTPLCLPSPDWEGYGSYGANGRKDAGRKL